jgi:hypothetical protein
MNKLLVLMCAFSLPLYTACYKNSNPVSSTDDKQENTTKNNDTAASDTTNVTGAAGSVIGETHEDSTDYVWDESDAVRIALNGYTINVTGTGVSVDGAIATITAAGTYSICGTLYDGRIIVDTDDDETVTLVLNGAVISSSSYAPLFIKNAKKMVVVLADGTVNSITDYAPYVVYVERIGADSVEDIPNAAIFCMSDLTIYGNGALIVNGKSADGITSKDGLIIASGTILVTAVDDGIRGKDYLVIEDGHITVKAGGDGLKSDNTSDVSLGYVSIEDGVVDITAVGDAITAVTSVIVSGGTVQLKSGGGNTQTIAADASAKGIKAGVSITINSGNVIIDSSDDGINSNDKVTITGGTITISSGDDGINTKNTLTIENGYITVTADGDGIKAENDEDTTKGSITITTGEIEITAGGDAIAAATTVLIKDGYFTLTSGGGSTHPVASGVSAKGIKGLVSVSIDDGTFFINSADDAIHSNGTVTINDGDYTISTGDDAFHADTKVIINGGDIDVLKSYEGLESVDLTINNGIIHITASDDGVNGAGGVDGSGVGGWGGGVPQGNCSLSINGGYIVVSAAGDGFDINGSIVMTNGEVIINGPTANNNSAIDYDSSFVISGGTIIGAGSSGMAQTAGTSSSQYSVLIKFNSVRQAGTLFALVSNADEVISCMKPEKTYQSIAFSSPKLIKNTTYKVYTGGSSTGILVDSLYQGGTYTPGTQYTSFTITGTVTTIGGGGFQPPF